jgi:hypothetical protein
MVIKHKKANCAQVFPFYPQVTCEVILIMRRHFQILDGITIRTGDHYNGIIDLRHSDVRV